MPLISRDDAGNINLRLDGGDVAVSIANNGSHTYGSSESTGKSFGGTINVIFTRKYSYPVRKTCQSRLDLGVGLGTSANNSSFANAIWSSPIPIAPVRDTPLPESPEIPPMATTDMDQEFSVSFSGTFKEGGRYVIVSAVGMKSIHLSLVDVTNGGVIAMDHPGVATNPFTIPPPPDESDLFDDDAPADDEGDGGGEMPYLSPMETYSVEDANVHLITVEKKTSLTDVFYAEVLRAKGKMKKKLIGAYIALLEEMKWDEGGAPNGGFSSGEGGEEGGGNDLPPSIVQNTMCGVDVTGHYLHFVELAGRTVTRFKGSVVEFFVNQNFEFKYYYGDIMYPANPSLGNHKVVFDIITDSQFWTDNGPTAGEYEGGSGGSCDYIFSWEGRNGKSPISMTAAMAGLNKNKK